MLDIHSHILPNIDDGAKDLDTFLKMINIAKEDGYKNIIATPHFYRGYYECEYKDVFNMIKDLNSKLIEKRIDMEILPGQEVFLDNQSKKLYKQGKIGTLNRSRYMLVETSMMSMKKDVLDILYELRLENIVPVLAHPERYKYIIEKPSNINDFIKEGCLFQINTGSLRGIFGKSVKKTAKTLVKQGICNFIASDAHSTGRRCPGLNSTMDIVKSINEDVFENLDSNCDRLLKNNSIEAKFEGIKERKSIFSFFRR